MMPSLLITLLWSITGYSQYSEGFQQAPDTSNGGNANQFSQTENLFNTDINDEQPADQQNVGGQQINQVEGVLQNQNPNNTNLNSQIEQNSSFFQNIADDEDLSEDLIEIEEDGSDEPIFFNRYSLPLSGPAPSSGHFSGAPPVPGTLRVLADGEAPEEYVVQEGDTLFDICDQLIDEPGYWPKLWALNPYIKNPHFVWPGMRLRFYPGDEEQPPYLEVVNDEDLLAGAGEFDESQLLVGQVPDFDVGTVEEVEVVGPDQIDSSFGDFLLAGANFENGNRLSIVVPGFIYSEDIDYKGEYIGGVRGELLGQKGNDLLFADEEGLQVGQSYLALRYRKFVSDSEGDDVGYLYDFIASVRLTARLSDEDIYIGNVDINRLGLQPGDVLVDYQSVKRTMNEVSFIGSTTPVSSEIVAFDQGGQVMAAQGDLLFLTAPGLSVGQFLDVYQTFETVAASELKGNFDGESRPIAQVRVIDVQQASALAYVVLSNDIIRLGDRTARSTGEG